METRSAIRTVAGSVFPEKENRGKVQTAIESGTCLETGAPIVKTPHPVGKVFQWFGACGECKSCQSVLSS